LSVSGKVIHYSVDGNPSKVTIVTNKGRQDYNGTNSVDYSIEKGVNFVRFETFYDNDEKKDFIFSNPVWVEDNEDNVSMTQKNILIIL
jgi:hypothetical protein